MAKKEKDDKQEQDKQEPMTLQEYIIARLDQPVLVKGGSFATDPVDEHHPCGGAFLCLKYARFLRK